MPVTSTELVNRALLRLGAAPITDLTEDSEKARKALMVYEPVVTEVLRSHRWKCALKRVELAEDGDEPLNEWAHQYALPIDCLRVIKLGCGLTEFEINGRLLLTDAETATIKYIARVNESNFDSMLCKALVLQLAADMAYGIQGSDSMRAGLLQELNQIVLPDARYTDAIEAYEPVEDAALTSDWISARFGGSTRY